MSIAFAACLVLLSLAVPWPALATPVPASWGSFELLGLQVAPGTRANTSFIPFDGFEAGYLDTPVRVARGVRPGPTLCVVAGIHGDEMNGPEIARRVSAAIDPAHLAGTLVVVPAANAHGFRTGNRYMADRRDLNRSFPGSRTGSVASIVAEAIFSRVVRRCDVLIDLHTGSMARTNVPQLRVDFDNARALEIARQFGVGVVLGGAGPRGSLRREAMEAGIPAVIYEAGEPHRFQAEEIARGVEGIDNVLAFLGMIPRPARAVTPARVYPHTDWVRVPVGEGGVFFPDVALGTRVAAGALLGTITSPDDDRPFQIRAPFAGEVIGMAVPSIVLSGYGVFHLGRDAE